MGGKLMLIFEDRHDAGMKLAQALMAYQKVSNAIVIGLPRGGVVTAYEVARYLELPLDVVCPRKIGAPQNPELAIGAITETGEGIFDESLIERLGISQEEIRTAVKREKAEAAHRIALFRKGRPQLDLSGKIVILVDDGLATGATMRAAIKSVRASKPEKIVVAVPTAPFETVQEIEQLANEVVCLDCPAFFQAVGQFYENFSQVEDAEVIALLNP
jgi:putative phosphoribosyl transferase